MLYPVAPHVCSEIYEMVNDGAIIENAQWPTYDEKDLVSATIEIPVQVNGKLKAKIVINKDAEQEEVLDIVNKQSDILGGKQIIKVIYVKGRILNIVAK